MMLAVNPERMLADLKRLAEFGKYESGVNRRALSAEDIAAREWLKDRMHAGGLEARIDGIGNVIGTTPGCKRYILIGSHTDTVPKGGWLDGSMGVILGLEVARAWLESKPHHDTGIQVISFNDEEGRFAGLLGSSVFCGLRALDEISMLGSDDGIQLGVALQNAGYAGRSVETLDPERHVAYLEPHIEQGPVLESTGSRIGVVTEIVGAERAQVRFYGQADHAGTTPMIMRKDAAAALYDFAVRFAGFCRAHGGDTTVWNLGNARLDPGAYNVVAKESLLYIEYRDRSAQVLTQIREFIPRLADEVAAVHSVNGQATPGVRMEPAAMHSSLVHRVEVAAAQCGVSSMRMVSGAGHDAMQFAPKIPTGMLFVPSVGGRSHDVAENTREDDICLGLEVLGKTVSAIIEHGVDHAKGG